MSLLKKLASKHWKCLQSRADLLIKGLKFQRNLFVRKWPIKIGNACKQANRADIQIKCLKFQGNLFVKKKASKYRKMPLRLNK